MKLPNSIVKKLKSLQKSRGKVYDKYSVISDQLNELDSYINYYDGIDKIKPNILMNQGRDKKYVYGQVYYYHKPGLSTKKSFRFLIGKMVDNKSTKEWNEICIQHFIDKVVSEYI